MKLDQLTFLSVEHRVNPSQLQDRGEGLMTPEETLPLSLSDWLYGWKQSGSSGRTSRASLLVEEEGTLVPSSGRFGTAGIVLPGECLTLNGLEYPSDAEGSSLSDVLEEEAPSRYYLSPQACEGILRRAERRGKKLPETLEKALLAVTHASPSQLM